LVRLYREPSSWATRPGGVALDLVAPFGSDFPVPPPKVFISYSHDTPEHSAAVLSIADRLRADGVDAILDVYEPAPSQGWPRWMNEQIEAADCVLIVCTKTYLARFERRAPARTGRGVKWEGAIITQKLYEDELANSKYIPLVLAADDAVHVPPPLRPVTYYDLSSVLGYERLYRRLTDQPETPRPELGTLRVLPPAPGRSAQGALRSAQRSGLRLHYYCYISRAKVDQLFAQLPAERLAPDKQRKTSKNGFDLARVFGAGVGAPDRERSHGQRGADYIQKLMSVVDHVSRNEKVYNLNELCLRKEGTRLDAFCYLYEGQFSTVGALPRRKCHGSITITREALERYGEVTISRDMLVEPAWQDNDHAERGPNNAALVSDIAVLCSTSGPYTLQLACSYKYFSDMGGSYHEYAKEWAVLPHSGNHFFFEGKSDARFTALLFVNGKRDNVIMGTPLCLLLSRDSGIAL
jgi:hypothetical protein